MLSLSAVCGKTHNLEFLTELRRKQDSAFEEMETGSLTFYTAEIRYPDEFYPPSLEEVKIVKKR
ncbi:MAG: hypothetical protein PWP42_636 [Candidatus Atribacteria bacterium]|jgi:hypothetical protein|nr:hypothetical protein [Candidatus Atribacteria bacterium]